MALELITSAAHAYDSEVSVHLRLYTQFFKNFKNAKRARAAAAAQI